MKNGGNFHPSDVELGFQPTFAKINLVPASDQLYPQTDTPLHSVSDQAVHLILFQSFCCTFSNPSLAVVVSIKMLRMLHIDEYAKTEIGWCITAKPRTARYFL